MAASAATAGFRHVETGRTIVFGRGAVAAAADLLGEGYTLLTTRRAVDVTPGVASRAGAVVEVPEGLVEVVAAGLRARVRGDRLVALGGGRVVDVAKALAAADPPREVVAIPTSPAGAEMTGVHRHALGVPDDTPRVRPSVVVNDPGLSASLPAPALAAGSCNALGHAVTGLLSARATPIGAAVAREAILRIAAAWTEQDPDRDAVALGALLAWWDVDEHTAAALLYLEGVGDARRFARIARRVSRRTPVVALKGGRGGAGSRAAGSHTAALAAGEPMTDALFDLAGVVRADTLEELLETGEVLASQPLPAGRRLGILSNAGGPAILAADAAEGAGLEVPAFTPPLRRLLASLRPAPAATGNPVDLGAGVGGDVLERAGRVILTSGEVDALLVIVTPLRGFDAGPSLRAAEALANDRMPVVGCIAGPRPDAARDGATVPWQTMPEGAVRALAGAWRASCAARRPEDPAQRPDGLDPAAARAAVATADPAGWLAPAAVEAVLRAYGIAVPRAVVAGDAAAAAAAQEALGVPAAVKLVSRTLTHKSDVGGVVLDVRTPADASEAFARIAAALRERGLPAGMDGVVVQEMAPPGTDLIVGGVQDPLFGPAVLAGVGGTQAEVWRDRRVALAPVGPAAARELWDGLRGAALLDGWRGLPSGDRDALADLTARVAWLLSALPAVAAVS